MPRIKNHWQPPETRQEVWNKGFLRVSESLWKEPILPTPGFQNPNPQSCREYISVVLSLQYVIICYTALGNECNTFTQQNAIGRVW